jgi:hypothetical protein
MKSFSKYIILASIFIVSACAVPKYTHFYTTPKSLDLRYGGWLVNYASGNVPYYIKHSVERKAIEAFKEMGVDTIFSLRELILDYITPDHFTTNLSQETLSLLKQTTDFSYILSIETTRVKDELSGLMLSAPEVESESISEVALKVYDIKSQEMIYHHRVVGKVTMDEEYPDYSFAKSANGLVNGAMKKALKKIRKYSIKS